MFTLEDTKKLVETLNTGVALNESEAEVLANECFAKLSKSFDECAKKAYDKAVADTREEFKKERVKAFKRGKDAANECTERSVSEAEKNGFEAGKEVALKEAYEDESELVDSILGTVKKLCQNFDKVCRLVELVTKKDTEQEMQESFKTTIADFLDKKINESFPTKLVIDYDRLNVLENVCESFKKTLCINDKEVAKVVESTKNEIMQEFDETKEALKNQTQRRIQAEQLLESTKAENLLLKKVAKLPVGEQKALMESFKGASIATINESFDSEYQKLQRSHQAKAVASKPVVNDVICESANRRAERESRKTVNESTARVNESAKENVTPAMARMNSYAEACKYINF
jgi:hypothetical protein